MSTLNYTIVGSPTYTGEIVSGFSSYDYLRFPPQYPQDDQNPPKSVVASFTTGADINSFQDVFGSIFNSRIYIYEGEIQLSDWRHHSKIMDVSANTKYYLKLTLNNAKDKITAFSSTDGQTWTEKTSITQDSIIHFFSFDEKFFACMGYAPQYSSTTGAISEPFLGSIDISDYEVRTTSDTVIWKPVTPGSITGLSYGSILITKGFYNSGTAQIRMPTQTIPLADLMDGQEVSYKNKTFACSYNGTASVAITSEAAPSGTYDVYVDLNHPLYLSNLQNYLIGDTPSKSIEIGFNRAGSTPLANDLTENGTAGGDTSAAFSSTNEGSYYAYKAFDGNSSTFWNPSSASNPQDLTRYYPSTVHVNSVRFVCREKPSAGSIQISEDNVTYTTIGSFSNNTSADFTVSCDDSVGGKYIRFHKTGNNTGWGGIYEMIINTTTIAEIHTAQKGFLYDETANRTFWFHNQVTLPFTDFTAVADKCTVYAINSTESDLASLEVNTSAPQDADSYTLNGYVFLNRAHDTILKTGQLPDEITLEATAPAILDCTQVGTPTITSDFVASGFSSSDYLKPNLVFPSSGTIIVLMKVSVDSAFSANQPFLCTPTGDRGLYIQNSSKKFAFYDGTGRISNTVVSAGKTYWVRYGFITSSKASSIRVIEDQGYTEETLPDISTWDSVSWTSSENTFGGLTLQIGYNTGSGLYYDCGKIYLENVSYTQDNVEVWRAASTVITHYTVVGSPVVSDYIASSFADASYITSPNAFTPGTGTWEIGINFVTGEVGGTQQYQGILTGLGNTNSCSPFYISGNRLIAYLSSDGSSWDIENGSSTGHTIMTLYSNTAYKIKVEFTGSAYNWYSYENGSWVLKYTVSSSSNVYGGVNFVIGNNRGKNNPFLGSIDLTKTYAKINGTEVWRAVEKSQIDTITVDPVHYWTYLGKFTREEAGESLNVSSMTGTAISGYICYSPLGGLMYFEGTSEQVPDTSNLGYPFTGYTVTFTDSTHTAIDKLELTGTRCRMYSYISGYYQKCVAVTYDQYNAGVPAGTVVKYNISSDSGLPLSCTADRTIVGHTQPDPIGDDYYDPATDTFYIYDGVSQYDALSYLDDYFVNLP